MGKGKAVAICTLSSRTYCTILSNSELMADLLIADTLLSENKGIDAMINFTLKHPELSRIIICGKEVKVHRVGQVLLALRKNGMSSSGSIIGAASPFAILESSAEDVDALRVK